MCYDRFMDTNYRVTGMNCEHCVRAVTDAISAVAGVAAVAVDLDAGEVRVRGERVDPAAVRAAIDEAGYEVAA